MAFHKAQLNKKADWVGYSVSSHDGAVEAEVKESFMEDMAATTGELLEHNYISLKTLRSYTGRANHIANLLFSWRPFLDALWAACSGGGGNPGDTYSNGKPNKRKRARALKGTIWTKQVMNDPVWIKAFLDEVHGPLKRTWTLEAFQEPMNIITMVLDASLGA